MTEEEAKTKWCPFARVMISADSDGGGAFAVKGPIALGSANRFKANERAACIASECMAWRWRTVPNPAWKPDASMMMAQYLAPNPYSQTPAGIASSTDGYCGLAGAPQ